MTDLPAVPQPPRRKPWGWAIQVRENLDLEMVKQCGARGMSVKETAALLGVSVTAFYEWRQKDEAINAAFESGRATMIAQCAKTVCEAAKTDPRTALEYLRRHGERWGDKIAVDHTGEVGIVPGGAAPAKLPDIPEATATRMAKIYLEQRGWTLIPPGPIITVEASPPTEKT